MPVVYFVQLWIVHRPDLSSAPAADFIDVVDLISVVKFDNVLLCHSSTVSSSLGQSIIQVSNSCQHTVALTVVCCRTRTLPSFAIVTRAATS
jgi:hypothetical protein